MTERDEQLERFREAVDRKSAEAQAASEATRDEQPSAAGGAQGPIQPDLIDHAHQQDDFSVRDKNSGHGKKTADKWNQ